MTTALPGSGTGDALTAEPAPLPGVRALFTGVDGGHGRGAHGSANLALHVGEDPTVVARNRELLSNQLGAPVVFVDQVHSAEVHVLPAEGEVPVRTADALVTDRSDVALAIMVADCLPVLLTDPEAGVVAAAHAGRAGLLGGVLQQTLVAMEELGARAPRISAAIGPSICGRCYEVPDDMRTQAAQILPAAAATTSWGTPALDLRAGAVQALQGAGVPQEAIASQPPCTLEDERFYSYRRARTTGRFVGAIMRA